MFGPPLLASFYSASVPFLEINTQQPDHPHLLAQRVRPRNRSEAPAVAEPAQPAPAEAAQPQAAPPLQVDLPQATLDFFIANTCGDEVDDGRACENSIKKIDAKYARSKDLEIRKAYLFTMKNNYAHMKRMNELWMNLNMEREEGWTVCYNINGIVTDYLTEKQMAAIQGTSTAEVDDGKDFPGTVRDNSYTMIFQTKKPLRRGQKFTANCAGFKGDYVHQGHRRKVFMLEMPKNVVKARKDGKSFRKDWRKYNQLLELTSSEFEKITQ